MFIATPEQAKQTLEKLQGKGHTFELDDGSVYEDLRKKSVGDEIRERNERIREIYSSRIEAGWSSEEAIASVIHLVDVSEKMAKRITAKVTLVTEEPKTAPEVAKAHGYRSLAEAARAMGVAINTAKYWHKHYPKKFEARLRAAK